MPIQVPEFLETPRFPDYISRGSVVDERWRTAIVASGAGFDVRAAKWVDLLTTINVGLGVSTREDMVEVREFHRVLRGAAGGFRIKCWSDFSSQKYPGDTITHLDQPLGTSVTGTETFQITKTETLGAETYVRNIYKPVDGTVLLGVDSVDQSAGYGTTWTVDHTTGQLTLIGGTLIGVLTVGYEFDLPARFESDGLPVRMLATDVWDASLVAQEIRVSVPTIP